MSSYDSERVSNGLSIRFAANFTIEPIEEFLSYWMSKLGISCEIRFAPYNQVFQQLLEGGLLRNNRGGINLVALDLNAWLPTGSLAEALAELERVVGRFLSLLRASSCYGAGGAVLVFPTDSHRDASTERARAVAAARTSILTECAEISGWSALDLSEAVTLYSVFETHDPFTDELGNIPFTEEMYAAAATACARWIRATCSKPRKVIVLDCDYTLWEGICGEGSVEVTPPYHRLQEFMLHQREKGMLLALVSKNNEDDVMRALESEACPLGPQHLASWRINWQPKSENLMALGEELGLALNSFIFVDDSAYECMEIRNRCSEVLVIQLPSESSAIPQFIDHLWVFDIVATTDEDRNRSPLYQAERQRNELRKQYLTIEDFLASLRIEIEFALCTDADLSRVAQLTQRTTQFNLTGVLHTEQSLSSLLADGRHECWTVRVRDVFGDYGLVGVALFEKMSTSLRMEVLLLSCRALGRRVEHYIVEQLKRLATERGVNRLVFAVVPTARNQPALDFVASLCGIPADSPQPFECALSVTSNAWQCRPMQGFASHAELQTAAGSKLPALTDEEDKMTQIAIDLQTAASIVASLRGRKKRRPAIAGPLIQPSNALEEALVRIWSDCLGVEPVGTRDNFFDFGGHSLRATRVLTRVQAEFGVELSLTTLFKNPTIDAMARTIVAASSGRSNETECSYGSSRSGVQNDRGAGPLHP
jgi:FkbH-like protein